MKFLLMYYLKLYIFRYGGEIYVKDMQWVRRKNRVWWIFIWWKKELYNSLKAGITGKTEIIYDISGKLLTSPLDKTPYGFYSSNIDFIYGTMNTENNNALIPLVKTVLEDSLTCAKGEGNTWRKEYADILVSILEGQDFSNEEPTSNEKILYDKFYLNPYYFDYNQDTKVDD